MNKPRYLTKKFIDQQKQQLLIAKENIINSIKDRSNEDIHISSDQVVEDGDQAQTYINQNVSLGLRGREQERLKEIEFALKKIEEGTYGICEEYETTIDKKRLEKMPWTRLCIEAAEDLERQNIHYKAS